MTVAEHDVREGRGGTERGDDAAAAAAAAAAASGTRAKILALLLRHPDSTAAEIAGSLELTSAGVRRHLENLGEDGLVMAIRRPARGRGRPARAWRLTARGRGRNGDSNGQLALEALEALREVGGSDAVYRFAEKRFSALVDHVVPARSPNDVERVATELAAALSAAGYEASVAGSVAGVQLCQHHCPVWDVAAQCPELCAAEQDVLEVKLGTHVQRLATLAVGNCACTTNIPTARADASAPVSASRITSRTSAERGPASAAVTEDAVPARAAFDDKNRKDEVS